MKYNKIIRGIFHSRPNRFIANVYIDGDLETVHVKNTGRCKELLVNIDSQLCNKVAHEWLVRQGYDFIKPEYTYGASRVDFYMERNGEKYLMEVKGCTLEIDGVGYFPDAPTERGVKHLKELTTAVEHGFHCSVAFVIPMEGITEVRANMETHPAFGDALEAAKQAGVEVVFLPCKVSPDEVYVVEAIYN